MLPPWETDCPFHLQDDPDWCGAAVSMMVLADLGISYAKLGQSSLFADIQKENHAPPNSPWLSDPYGIEAELGKLAPGAWKLYLQKTILDATRDVVYSVRALKQPPVVLVEGGGHWEVVDAVETDKDPASGDFHVTKLWLHNPAVDGRLSPSGSHGPNDVCSKNYAPDLIDWEEWKSYFVANSDPLWGGRYMFVSVCDANDRGSFGRVLDIVRPALRDVSPVAAGRRAQEYLENNGVGPYPGAQGHVDGAQVSDVLRVEYLSPWGSGAYFYLAIFVKDDEVVASIKLDGNGEFRSLRVHRGEFFSPEQFRARFMGGTKFEDGRFVWRPCFESRSPHMPFLLDVRGSRLVRLDGVILPVNLTDLRKGS